MLRASQVELTNLCVLCDGSRLLVERKAGKGIVFPGGHVEAGESMREAIVREMREETGLTILNPVLCGVKDRMLEEGVRYLVALYRADQFTGELRSSREGEVFWVEREAFEQMEVIWGMKEVLRICESETLSEMFYQDDGWNLL